MIGARAAKEIVDLCKKIERTEEIFKACGHDTRPKYAGTVVIANLGTIEVYIPRDIVLLILERELLVQREACFLLGGNPDAA